MTLEQIMSEENSRQHMKAITLHQPWASLLAYGVKKYETRSWPCPEKFLLQRMAGIRQIRNMNRPDPHGNKLKQDILAAFEAISPEDWPKVRPVALAILRFVNHLTFASLIFVAACGRPAEEPTYTSEPLETYSLPEVVMDFRECVEKCRVTIPKTKISHLRHETSWYYKQNEIACTEACKLVYSCPID